ncbi:MAG: hemin uptake protein HemP [Pseudoxanthomonas sp.]
MSAQPVILTHPGSLGQPERVAKQPMQAERSLSSAVLLNGCREILISHGDRVYRLRHTSNDKLILTK